MLQRSFGQRGHLQNPLKISTAHFHRGNVADSHGDFQNTLSMPQRQEYHCTHWVALSTVSTATVVNNSHSMGVTSAGGSTSWTWTAHSVTTGKPSRWRWRGGRSLKVQNRSANVASRATCGPRRGTFNWRWAPTGCAVTVAQTERSAPWTHRSHAARISRSTPAGRGAANTS